jgi:hypothetical protein
MPNIELPPSARAHRLPWYSPRSGVFRVLVPLLAIAAIGVWIYWSTSNAPVESNRVTHPAGYSIVKPREWVAKMQVKPSETCRDAITLEPEKWISLEPSIWVKRLISPPGVQKLQDSGFVEGEFQGHKAWLSQQKPRRRIVRVARFPVGSDWYEVGVNLPGLEGARIDDWWQFALTFHPAPSAQPAPSPATAPATAPAGVSATTDHS